MPTHAVLSDIHANLPAFEEVLADMSRICPGADIWCLGDTVMYGPQPLECLQLLREKLGDTGLVVPGNNDAMTVDDKSYETYVTEDAFAFAGKNKQASDLTEQEKMILERRNAKRIANFATLKWTRDELNKRPDELDWLKKICQITNGRRRDDCLLVHASPCEPVGLHGNYLREEADVEEALLAMIDSDRMCFFGHTHRPSVFVETNPKMTYANCENRPAIPGADGRIDLKELRNFDGRRLDLPRRIFLNPGSVGQPRTLGDRRAGYLIYDDEKKTVEFRRVEYKWQITRDLLLSHPHLSTLDYVPEAEQASYTSTPNIVAKTLVERIEEAS